MAPSPCFDAKTTEGTVSGKMATSSTTLVFFVNGKKVVDEAPDPTMTLLTYLRQKLRLCGTKLGCGEGGCGACTVMVSRMDRSTGQIHHLSVNACLAPAVSMHGLAVTTVEGIGNAKGRLHIVQQRLADSHGSQCGFCTPGIVMSMYTLLRNNPQPTMKDMETYFQGNLCRCTGYRPILEGYRTLTEEWTKFGPRTKGQGCGRAGGCCMDQKSEGDNGCQTTSLEPDLVDESSFVAYEPSQEPLFPPELSISPHLDHQELFFRGKRSSWYRPVSLTRMLALLQDYPGAKIVVGNTEVGVEVKFKHCEYPVYISPTQITELTSIDADDLGLTFGASVTLSRLEAACLKLMARLPAWKTRILHQIVEMLQWFAGKQIRNVAAIGGNIMTGSPISDLNPILMAAGAVLTVQSAAGGIRQVPFDSTFYTGYRRNILQPDELLVSIYLPFLPSPDHFFVAYKQARRRDDDIAIVNAAFSAHVTRSEGSPRIASLRMAFGGMAPTTVLAERTASQLVGFEMVASDPATASPLVERACCLLTEELALVASAPGAMIRYRRSLVLSFFFKFYLELRRYLELPLAPADLSATERFDKAELHSHQLFQISQEDQKGDLSVLGRPLKHRAADHQVAGSAQYTDDIPATEGELYLGLVLSTRAHARILSVDTTQAMTMAGVLAYVDHRDVPGSNMFSIAIIKDELVFAVDEVFCQGMIIGAIVAQDQETAQRAARSVKVSYEDLPAIISMEEAIAASSFHAMPNTLLQSNAAAAAGDVDAVFAAFGDNIVEGEVRTGAQEHFYLETHACIAVPGQEEDEIEVLSSTQNPAHTQGVVASVLGVPANRVRVRVRRMGGGFGGKESRSIPLAAVAAVCARKVGQPVRIMLDRDEDMMITGQRHPFLGRYRVGFDATGRLLAADVALYCNAGWSMDLSFSVTERAMYHSDNSYKVPYLRVRGHCCKTNLPSNTAFRGFGGPQGMLVVESWIDQVARKLNRPPEVIRELNLYQEGDRTHFNQPLIGCTLQRCWAECAAMSRFDEKRREVEEWNRQNRWKKRGLSMLPVKFGIAFTSKFLNQSGALVMVYTDGSVLLSHGGTEMGQGLHTKMIQVASKVLGIEHSKIHIAETATDKVPNTPPTAASAGSDLNGMAVLEACTVIKSRLQPYKDANPTGTWEDWVRAAYFDRVSLSSTGFHATPDIGYDFKTNSGNPFNYFTYGVAFSLVEIDCLTGDHQVLSTNIVMDLGESLNPAIDIGQVEGAFMQGYGLFMLEQMVHSPAGMLLTRGPGAYKIPSFNDIPGEFNVSLLRGAPNPRAVFSSKAVGEPPLFLASSVFFAVKDAIRAARQAAGVAPDFHLDAPATAERIRMACEDDITKKVPELPPANTYTPWGIQV